LRYAEAGRELDDLAKGSGKLIVTFFMCPLSRTTILGNAG
jgi:hypothetical protein